MEETGVPGGNHLQECDRRFSISRAKCDSSPFDHQSISTKDHFINTAKMCEIPIVRAITRAIILSPLMTMMMMMMIMMMWMSIIIMDDYDHPTFFVARTPLYVGAIL